MAVQNGNHLQRLYLWSVNDEVGINWEELHCHVSQTLVRVSSARRLRQENNFIADDGLHTIRNCNTALLLDVTPDLDEIMRGLWCEDIAHTHSGLAFNVAR